MWTPLEWSYGTNIPFPGFVTCQCCRDGALVRQLISANSGIKPIQLMEPIFVMDWSGI